MEEIGKLLPGVLREQVRRSGPRLIEILDPLWRRVAGKAMAQHCRPVAFDAGTLTLATDCPTWSAQLRQMAEEIRAKVNSFLGDPVVKKLRILKVARLDVSDAASRRPEAALAPEPNGKVRGARETGFDPEAVRANRPFRTEYSARHKKQEH